MEDATTAHQSASGAQVTKWAHAWRALIALTVATAQTKRRQLNRRQLNHLRLNHLPLNHLQLRHRYIMKTTCTVTRILILVPLTALASALMLSVILRRLQWVLITVEHKMNPGGLAAATACIMRCISTQMPGQDIHTGVHFVQRRAMLRPIAMAMAQRMTTTRSMAAGASATQASVATPAQLRSALPH
jgi:hypothetical protein